MKAIENFAGILFMSRDAAHQAHLQTRSYAARIALNDFYEGVLDLADEFIESAQGKHGLIDFTIAENKMNIKEPAAMLQDHLKKLERLSNSIEDRFLQNIIDEILALYYSTLYKLEYLS